jgi:protein O-mannosyl-transferase
LGAYGPVDNPSTFLRYVTSGTADPTGRPLALASFLIDANDWPADPYPFKRSNLILHLLNGMLLAWLLALLGIHAGLARQHATRAAVLASGIWLLHPLLVSTTLYIVQRHAMLPATFTLAGLIGYVYARGMATAGRQHAGGILACIALTAATLLALLSKANGILLPLLAGVLELTVLSRLGNPVPPAFARLRWLLIGLPTLAVASYLAHQTPTDLNTYPEFRPWTYWQRLITQPRVLWEYLHLLWLPRPYTAGVFNDQFQVSASIHAPWTTLPALIGLMALGVLSIFNRHKHPLFAAAVLFFLAGHVLESTIIPLELYYEHRNYLPALLLFWPLASWLTDWTRRGTAKIILAAVILGMLATMTHLRASLWGKPQEQALLWAALNPASPRAIANAAQFEIRNGRAQAAEARLREALARHPGEVQLTLNLISARCAQGGIDARDLDLAANSLKLNRLGTGLMFKWLTGYVSVAAKGQCPGLTLESLEHLIEAAESNVNTQRSPGYRQDVQHLKGLIALERGDAVAGQAHFLAAYSLDPNPAIALQQAAESASRGHHCMALEVLRQLENKPSVRHSPPGMAWLHEQLLQYQGYWDHEIKTLRKQIEQDVKNGACAYANHETLSP